MNARTKAATLASALLLLLPLAVFSVAQSGDEGGPADGDGESPAPPADDSAAYMIVYAFHGALSCGIGTGSLSPDPAPGASADLCFYEDVTTNGWANDDPTFEAPAASRAAVLELKWGPRQSPFQGETLSLTAPQDLETPFEANHTQTVGGPSILRLDLPSAAPGGTTAAHAVRVQPGYDVESGLVYRLPFELRATVFVNQDVPDDYSAFGDDEA